MANEELIPGWVFDHRKAVCFECQSYYTCKDKMGIAKRIFICPLGKIKPLEELIAERAWPSTAESISGCCDSALNY